MRVCFVAVGEKSPAFLNMIKLLLYSIRKNAGVLRNAPVYIVINATQIPNRERAYITKKYAPVYIRTMPRLGGTPHTNKFNAFYAVEESDYDVMIFLDCDTVVLQPLDEIVNNIDSDTPFISAISAGKSALFAGYASLLKQYCNLSDRELASYENEAFVTKYPLFNSGVIVITQPAVLALRNDAICISYDLYYGNIPKKIADYTQWGFYLLLRKIRSLRNLPKPIRRLAEIYLPSIASDFPITLTEQVGLSIAVIKNRIYYEILELKFNYNLPQYNDQKMPSIFHYMNGLYKIDRSNLFTGDWIEQYLSSESPMKRCLASLVKEYNSDSNT